MSLRSRTKAGELRSLDRQSSRSKPTPPTLGSIFLAFARLGITTFGGGFSAMMHAAFVSRLQWVDEDDFLTGLAVAQALPGVNVANLSIWLGYRVRGLAGAATALTAVILPPAVLIVLVGSLLLRLTTVHIGALALAGVAAAATGLSLSVGYRAARYASRDVVSGVILVATIVGSAFLHLSVLVLMAVLAPLGIGIAFLRHGREG